MRPSQDPGSIVPASDAPWLLYDLNTDYAQSRDLSVQHPDKLAHLRALFDTEAQRNKVLPVFDNPIPLLVPEKRPVMTAPGRYQFYPGDWRYNEGTFPTVMNRSWSVEADLTAPAGGGTGALVTQGSRFAGWGLLMLNGVPTFVYRNNLIDGVRLQAPMALTPGRHQVRVDFAVDGPGFGRGGALTLSIDGKPVGTEKIDRTVAFKFSYEPAVIGRTGGPSLLDDYQPPFAYDGELSAVTVDLQPVLLPGGEVGAK
jgi:arylsulfatase